MSGGEESKVEGGRKVFEVTLLEAKSTFNGLRWLVVEY